MTTLLDQATVRLTRITCCNSGCGITFAVPETWEAAKRRDHSWFFCPNGHDQRFPGETREAKLARDLAQEKHLREQQTARLRDRAERAERSAAATRGVVTRIKNRVGKVVCPCCSHTFEDLGRHMAGQHPDWSAA